MNRVTIILLIIILTALSGIVILIVPNIVATSTFYGQACEGIEKKHPSATCFDVNNLYSMNNDTISVIEILVEEVDDNITSLYDSINSTNTDVTSLTSRILDLESYITALTLLHYPESVTPPIIVPVPLPVQPPIIGPTPELAPDAPYLNIVYVVGKNILEVQFSHPFDLQDEPRGSIPPTFIIEWSKDGIIWESFETPNTIEYIRDLESYIEYLVKIKAVNEYGSSNYSTIHSGITGYEYGTGESGYIYRTENSNDDLSVEVGWNAAYTLFGFDIVNSVIERSVNYGNFTELVNLGTDTRDTYTDTDVTFENYYSYRIITTTTNEIHPRSGFNTIWYNATQN